MKTSKYIGRIYEGRWKCVKYENQKSHIYYTLENIYNGQQLQVNGENMAKIENNRTTVSKILAFRVCKERKHKGWNDFYSNSYDRRIRRVKNGSY